MNKHEIENLKQRCQLARTFRSQVARAEHYAQQLRALLHDTSKAPVTTEGLLDLIQRVEAQATLPVEVTSPPAPKLSPEALSKIAETDQLLSAVSPILENNEKGSVETTDEKPSEDSGTKSVEESSSNTGKENSKPLKDEQKPRKSGSKK